MGNGGTVAKQASTKQASLMLVYDSDEPMLVLEPFITGGMRNEFFKETAPAYMPETFRPVNQV